MSDCAAGIFDFKFHKSHLLKQFYNILIYSIENYVILYSYYTLFCSDVKEIKKNIRKKRVNLKSVHSLKIL